MSNILVCIPTLTGREDYLRNALLGYRTRSDGHRIFPVKVWDAPSCGVGWQRCIERAHLMYPWGAIDYIHFGNDDIVVGGGWADPLIEVARDGAIGAARMELAGVAMGYDPLAVPEPPPMPPLTARTSRFYFYADINQPTADRVVIDHCSLPFMSVATWSDVGPCIPIHFGTDKWLCRDKTNHPTVGRQESMIFNYAAGHGRNHDGWTELDFMDYDLCVAYPRYESGELNPTELPPERLTQEGLRLVQQVRAERW